MSTKLTLRLDAELIEAAKAYAAQEGRSVSEQVAGYFARLTERLPATPKAKPDVPRSSFYGICAPQPGEPMPDIQDYRDYLERKYS